MNVPTNALRVLLVDAESNSRADTAALLGRAVTKVDSAGTGKSALQYFQENRPDVVILDLMLPDMDGLALLRDLRGQDEEVPVMVIFDGYNPSSLLKSLDYNISGFLNKPIERKRLYQQLWRVTKEVLLRRKLSETKSMLEHTLDLFPAHVILVEKDSVTFVNRRLLDFLGFSSHMEMVDQDLSLDGFITELNGSDYDGKNGAWIRSIFNDPLDREHVVRMSSPRHQGGESRSFMVNFNEFHQPGVYLLHLSDVSEMQHERTEFEGQATLDPLTGAYNRRKFLEFLAIQEMYMATSGKPLSMLMFDIDHFKRVNDTYGHDVGDIVLKHICILAENNVREGDKLGRWGGEEFMVLLAGADLRQARALAERLRSAIESFDFPGVPDGCTSSFAAGQWQAEETRAAFLKRIDKALYRAKENGRNRVEIA